MLQFSFSTNGFVTKPEWDCEERPTPTYIENGMICRSVDFKIRVPIQHLAKKTVESLNSKDSSAKHNLWIRIKHDNHVYIVIFKDYHKRSNNTYQIPAQTDCVAATTDDTWVVSLDDMNPLTLDINDINYR